MAPGPTKNTKTEESAPHEKAALAINDYFVKRYRSQSGTIDFASVLNALGALAGFGCQMAVREGFIKTGRITEEEAFVVVETKSGEKYFWGDFLNSPLLATDRDQISVWSLVAGAAQSAGAKMLPEVETIIKHNAETVGSEAFGIPRVPTKFAAQELPILVLKKYWPMMQKLLNDNKVDAKFWGWTFALASQYIIYGNRAALDPSMAAKIVMEAALPMSKIDPASLVIK